ncbi:MAG: ATP synthase F0 subunit C [Candidatus Cloacimonetes bacterium]|nr:ATP synthase F0 subunit C [Candidatus Cloacimonadota bacterium]
MMIEFVNVSVFLGAALSCGVGGSAAGLAEGTIGMNAMQALGRQPKANAQLLRTLLIGVAVTETGGIFALVIGLLLLFGGLNSPDSAYDLARTVSFLAAGLAIGLGSMGSSFGSGYTAAESCAGVGRTPSHSNAVTSNMIVGQALTQTSTIFSLIISLLLLYLVPDMAENQSWGYQIAMSGAYLGAAMSIALGTIGVATGVGFVTGKAMRMIARFRENASTFLRQMFVGVAVVETCAIYSLVVAFLLLFK